MRKGIVVGAAVLALAAAACGEPAVSVDIPPRGSDQRIADLAGVLGEAADDLDGMLTKLAAESRLDTVVLTYESDEASCGEAYRAAKAFVLAWEADVALVAVAKPGDFTSTEQARERCVGVQPRNDELVSGGLREQIAENIVPPKAAENDWYGAFAAAAEAVADQ